MTTTTNPMISSWLHTRNVVSVIAELDKHRKRVMGLYSLSGWKSRSREIGWYNIRFGSEIWRAARQCCYRGACQISERLGKFKNDFRGVKGSRDLVVRRPSTEWMEPWTFCLSAGRLFPICIKMYSKVRWFQRCTITLLIPVPHLH